MYEEQIPTITAQVAEALAKQELPFAPDFQSALDLLRAPGWAEELAQLLPIRRRLECVEVLELCSPILPKLSPVPEDGWPSVTAISAASSTRRGTLPRTGRSTPVEPAFISRSSRCCWIRSAGHCPSILWRTFTFWCRRSILPATAPGSMSGF